MDSRRLPVSSTVALHFLQILAATAFLLLNLNFLGPADWLVQYNSVYLLITFVWALTTWVTKTGSKFDPYLLFLVAAFLFNAGQTFLSALGITREPLLGGAFDDTTLATTTFLIGAGLTAFHVGGLVGTRRGALRKHADKATYSISPGLFPAGLFLLAISVFPVLFLLRDSIAIVLSSGYFGLYQQEISIGSASVSQILANFFVPGLLLILVARSNDKRWVYLTGILIVAYTLIYFFLGYRGWATMPLLSYLWVYHNNVRPIPLQNLSIVGFVVLFVIFPTVAVSRVDTARELNLADVASSFIGEASPIKAILTEMGGSMQTVAYTTELVPAQRPHDGGLSYLYAMLTVVPNFFWELHPSIARGSPSAWLVQTVDPYIAQIGGGIGYSFIAEAYLNFGFWGSVLALGTQGFLLGLLITRTVRSGNAARVAAVACFFSFMFYYARQDSIFLFRPMVWYALVPYLFAILAAYVLPRQQKGLAQA